MFLKNKTARIRKMFKKINAAVLKLRVKRMKRIVKKSNVLMNVTLIRVLRNVLL